MWKFLLLIYFISVPIYGGTLSESIPDQKYIDYGKNIDCVVQMIGKQNNKISSQFSGVVIHPNWIITSAHTLDEKQKFYFVLGSNTLLIEEYYIHPDFNKTVFGSMDIGLCYVKDKINISFIPELYVKNDEIGRISCIAGYGMTGTAITGAIKWDGKKRAGTNFINRIENKLLICDMSRQYEKYTALEICIVPGDSGGGLFIDKKLAGVNSCVIHKDKNVLGKYGDETGHVRISDKQCIDWIKYIIYE